MTLSFVAQSIIHTITRTQPQAITNSCSDEKMSIIAARLWSRYFRIKELHVARHPSGPKEGEREFDKIFESK